MHKRLFLSLLLLIFIIFSFSMNLYYTDLNFHSFINQLFTGK